MTQLKTADLTGIKHAATAEDGRQAFRCSFDPSAELSNFKAIK